MTRNLIPGVIDSPHFKALLYGNLIGGIELAIAKTDLATATRNGKVMGTFLAQCQRKWDLQARVFDMFVK